MASFKLNTSLLSYLLLFILFTSGYLNVVVAQPVLSLDPKITTGLSAPLQLVNAGDGSNKVYIVQKGGTIRVYDAAFNFISVFCTVSNVRNSGEQGLLSMAFHPNYVTNRFFYVYYNNAVGDLELARYQTDPMNPDVALAASKVILKTINHQANTNHNGGELHFGNDGYLYLSTGDGGGAGDVPNNAQNTSVLLGKILRFDVNTSNTAPYYTIPATNPYGNEIFDLGLRNPFRWSFDRLTNDMWIGDVGQDSYEEVNYRAAASTNNANYGWRCYEGNVPYNTTGCGSFNTYVAPAYTYPTQNPSAAITGGIVYRGAIYTDFKGYYVSADFYSGIFYKLFPDGSGGFTTSTQTLSPTGIADFGETENGEAYVVSLTANSVSHIVSSGPTPVSLVSFKGNLQRDGVGLHWQTSLEINLARFEVEYSMNGITFSSVAGINARNIASGSSYDFSHPVQFKGPVYYRLKMVNYDGSYSYSNIIRLVLNGKQVSMPSYITNGILQVSVAEKVFTSLELISMNGELLLKKNITGLTDVQVPVHFPAGMYIVRLSGNAESVVEKIYIK